MAEPRAERLMSLLSHVDEDTEDPLTDWWRDIVVGLNTVAKQRHEETKT